MVLGAFCVAEPPNLSAELSFVCPPPPPLPVPLLSPLFNFPPPPAPPLAKFVPNLESPPSPPFGLPEVPAAPPAPTLTSIEVLGATTKSSYLLTPPPPPPPPPSHPPPPPPETLKTLTRVMPAGTAKVQSASLD